MKFLLCPDKFKGSASSEEVSSAIENAVLEVFPDAQISKALWNAPNKLNHVLWEFT